MNRTLLFLLMLAGCGSGADRGPIPIALGEDACGHCRMIVSEARHAAQARFGPSKVETFDDIGCMAARLAQGTAALEAWVVDEGSGRWIDARTARYARSEEIITPMASGLAAFADGAAAGTFAKEKKGKVMTWNEVLALQKP